MPLDYDMEAYARTLTVRTCGTCDTFAEWRRYHNAILKAVAEHGVARVLVDERMIVSRVQFGEMLRLLDGFLESAAGLSIAVVVDPTRLRLAHDWEALVSGNGVEWRTFISPEAARAWLASAAD